ncbi:lipid-A-disaccharide synthase [Thiospirillum jenense]|uniref:Lipid-A-disaccharide synthase n=1 Tax=Thiospirillum jenense TaxID=1653858 RepID=A0A839HBP8_9GAMM|nr:lipid-A-disaccharide synthase [Thiospirillum jenense]MBB1126403.1 lipid-A-disaccharide synthase [Thiospirillum jenense]
MKTIGIVANEPSGDILGAALITALRELYPNSHFIGVAGSRMLDAGCQTLLPMERLSVMGLIEVLRVLPSLLAARRQLLRYFLVHRPAVFIGIDAPDFNLHLERQLRNAGIPTVHLVCPTVWAWRPGRMKTIRKAVDLLLSLFPFEEAFLRQHQVPAQYIGHPLADTIPLQVDKNQARQSFGQSLDTPLVALLPGSRMSEVTRLAAPFIQTAQWCHQRQPNLRFITPIISTQLRTQFTATLATLAPELPITVVDGRSHEVIAAADVVLTASGTATLETLLLKRPMLVGYRLHPITWFLIKQLKLVTVPYAAMANLLVERELAPEFLQDRCNANDLGPALLALLNDSERQTQIIHTYTQIQQTLRRDAAHQAAIAIASLIK